MQSGKGQVEDYTICNVQAKKVLEKCQDFLRSTCSACQSMMLAATSAL